MVMRGSLTLVEALQMYFCFLIRQAVLAGTTEEKGCQPEGGQERRQA